jgi:hypothetical protein
MKIEWKILSKDLLAKHRSVELSSYNADSKIEGDPSRVKWAASACECNRVRE